ncbi:hypothetical protein VHUM_00317 [Vanrija humicola]|uniref:Saccharopine dehydrogenase NADP binding domain-containing protein n=1 Tax=Vanrija humicola TaxID=5417 RepID=A0A7D8V2A0_VANHU|nr:hypothetical protein VHUM_00317 [Vanrija humicola]
MPTIAVYGATAYTGREHLLPYLINHADAAKYNIILAGRSKDKLDALDDLLGKKGADRRSIVVTTLENKAGVDALVAKSDIVINLAGPYQLYNAPALIEACVNAGKHYLDLTGEAQYVANKVVPRFDFAAAKSGSVVIPMSGFDCIPGDIVIYHGLRALQNKYGKDVAFAECSNFYSLGAAVSGGTLASVSAAADAKDTMDIRDEWILTGSSVTGPTPRPQLVYSAPKAAAKLPAWVPSYGAFFVGYLVNRAAIRRSWYLSRMTYPGHGDKTVFKESLAGFGKVKFTNPVTATLFSIGFFFFAGIYMSFKFVRDLAKPYIPAPGTGPSMEVCENGFTNITNVSVSDGDKPVTVVTRYEAKGDPGYYHTSRILAECALSLVLPAPKGTALPPLAHVGGVLTGPSALGMVLVERMRINNVASITTEIIEAGAESKKDI